MRQLADKIASLERMMEMRDVDSDSLERLVTVLERHESLLRDLRDRLDWQDQKLHHQSGLLGLIADETRMAGDPRSRDPRYLGRRIAQVYSQSTEDAVVAEIISRIGAGNKTFVEIGLESGRENTTRFLLEHCGWTGLWIEMDPAHCEAIRKRFHSYLDSGKMKLIEAGVTAENVSQLVKDALRIDGSIDFLSIDIDRNTSHVWSALDVEARIVAIEYNASVPPSVDWEIEYDPDQSWDGTNVFGASLKALERIGRTKGMALVGCDPRGVNAFFVNREENLSHFLGPFDAETHYEPVRFALLDTRRGHRPRD